MYQSYSKSNSTIVNGMKVSKFKSNDASHTTPTATSRALAKTQNKLPPKKALEKNPLINFRKTPAKQVNRKNNLIVEVFSQYLSSVSLPGMHDTLTAEEVRHAYSVNLQYYIIDYQIIV